MVERSCVAGPAGATSRANWLAEIGELPYPVTTLRFFSGSAARCGDGSLLATGLGGAQGPQPVQEWLQLWA